MNKFYFGLTTMLLLATTVLAADKKNGNINLGGGNNGAPNLGKGGTIGLGNGNNGVGNQTLTPQIIKPIDNKVDVKNLPKIVDADKKLDVKKLDVKKLDLPKLVDAKPVLDIKKIDFKNPDLKALPKLSDIDKKILGNKLQNVNQNGSQNNLLKLSPKMNVANYQLQFGLKKSFGYCYQGFDHCHWTYCCWWGDCNCYCYWCPCTTVYYYWCVPDQCWYPITFCPYGVYIW